MKRRNLENEHRCAIPGCQKMVPRRLLMCGHHWACVPKPMQNAVYNTWRLFNSGKGTLDAYVAARGAAIDSVTNPDQL